MPTGTVADIKFIFASSKEALIVLEKEKIDILFLDIDMPGINGIEFRKKAVEVPVCVYISGHSEYAAESFELEALDFIVKPLRFERFERSVQRIEHYFEIKEKARQWHKEDRRAESTHGSYNFTEKSQQEKEKSIAHSGLFGC